MAITLDAGQKHMLKLIDRDKNSAGWTLVSDVLYPHLVKNMPSELVEFCGISLVGSYNVKLTTDGQNIIKAMEWL